jgi:hypothetical protein
MYGDPVNPLEAEFQISGLAMILTNRIIWLLAYELPPQEKEYSFYELRLTLEDLAKIRVSHNDKPPKARIYYRNIYIKPFSGTVRQNLAARLRDFKEVWPRSRLSLTELKGQVKELHVRFAADLARGEIEGFISELRMRSDRLSALYHQGMREYEVRV